MLYELTGLEKVLGGRRVLDVPALSIRAGRIYSLTGPNGAGKTTLLKILAFLDKPSSGEMRFHGEKVRHGEHELLQLRRQVVLVDQSPLLFTGTVAKNVEFGLKMRKVPKPAREHRVIEALRQVGMEGFLRAEAHKLSGGETKRVALARALAVRPQVLLCDEPTANVDSENQRIIIDILAGINRTEKTSIIFSTHYLSQEQELAHHSLQLQQGVLTESLADHVFRAELLTQGEGRSSYRLAAGMTLSLPDRAVPAAPVIHLEIDQRKILLPGDTVGDMAGSLVEGRVSRLEEENGGVRVKLEAGIGLTFRLSREAYQGRPFPVGEMLTVLIPDTAVHCLPEDDAPEPR
jgi:tungstate transport system ATP-binding protein